MWLPEDGVLFTGDCLIREYLPNLDAGRAADWQIWLDSLERIEALRPPIVVTGHGPVSRGPEVQTMVNAVRQILEKSLSRGSSSTATANQESA